MSYELKIKKLTTQHQSGFEAETVLHPSAFCTRLKLLAWSLE